MWIRRLAVAHWRGLDCELADLVPGLNLIHGPNETGKSRLVEALRFALFESSSGRSAHKKALATWGRAPGKPTVAVEFELHGTRWRVEKEFLGTGHNTGLRSETESHAGPEAEARLAELLGVGPGGRTERKPEDLGIWSLLWVDQGASREAPVPNESSQSRLHDRLTREIGEVAAGALGQRVLRRAEEQRNRFYTPSRDAEKSTLTEPRAAVAQLERRLEEAIARRDAVAADADALDRLRAEERDLAARLDKAEARLGDVRGQHEAAMELGSRLELYEEQVRSCDATRQRSAEALEAARNAAGLVARLEAEARIAARDEAAAQAGRQAAQTAWETASRLAAEADARYGAEEQRLDALRRRREHRALAERAERVRHRLAAAARVEARMTELQQALARLPRVTPQDVERLRAAQEARDAAAARVEGAAASVELTAHRDLSLSGERLPRGATRRILVQDEHRLEVDETLTLTIRPGGGELPRLRDAAADAERTLARLLAELAVPDVAEAARVALERRDQEAELERCRREREGHLPEGREQAEIDFEDLQARVAAVAEAAGAAGAGPADEGDLAEAEETFRALSTEREACRARRDAAADRLTAAREAAATRRADLESRRRQLDEARARHRALPELTALETALADADRTWRERVAARDALEERFDDLGGEDLALDLEQAERAAIQLRRELQQTRMQCVGLQARLEAAGEDGRHERVQELTAELTLAGAELAGIERQAAAARRLHDVLLEEYQNARERLTQPVISRIRPYLGSLFPGSEVWLDDELNLLGLRSRDTDQHFAALSGGAREQLALLVRIGLAEVLGADEPWPLVLDDVLVNTDAERILLVQRLLYQASRRMQILLFTCHGPLFDGLGAERRIALPPAPADARRSREAVS